MRTGLRLQILLLLGGLMLLSFFPLYFAIATYTRLTLAQQGAAHARSLGRAVASKVAEASATRSLEELETLIEAEVGSAGVEAVGVYDAAGARVLVAASGTSRQALPPRVPRDKEAAFPVSTEYGPALIVLVPSRRGSVAALVRTDDDANRVGSLLRSRALDMGLLALALLVGAYFGLTRVIVQPLDALGRAADRVASGTRRLDVPRSGARELVELGKSVRSMTDKLFYDELALRKKVEEVEQATRDLRAAQQRLVRSERLASVGRLAAGLAHELGNPISALIAIEELLLEGGLTEPEQRDFLRRMRAETERIHRILRDLLEFARPGGATRDRGSAPGSVAGAVQDTAALVSPQQAMQGVTLKLEVAADLPAAALAREQLVQVLLNLLLNAADACGEGGHIVVRARAGDRRVRLEVEDDGPGVSPEMREHIFDPFMTTKDVGHGTGLGLSVCRGLAESVGGTIELDSSYTGGARFVLELPSVVAAEAAPESSEK